MEPTIAQKSPYVREMAPGNYAWCACGLSKNQPFCDGSHKGTGFAPTRVEITEKKTVADVLWGVAMGWITMFGLMEKTPLIDAYMARRALDYLVGFTLSPRR